MISVDEATRRVLALAEDRALGTETVPLRAAAGRTLAKSVEARRDQPPFDASAMDGYAIRESDHQPGRQLAVIGEAGAGHIFDGVLTAGAAVRIFTGAAVPTGAERVVLQEDVTRDGDRITLGDRLETSSNIRMMGDDFKVGARIDAPRRLSPSDLALIASMNCPEVTVTRRPVVAIMATGDELVMPGEAPGPGQIIASNGFALAAMAEAAGAEARMLPIAHDNEASLRATFALAEGADVIVTVGGASVGDHDLVGPVAEALGLRRSFWKIAMRPGKPLMAGRMASGAAMLGLPGNPVSAVVCAKLFLIPLIERLQGLDGQLHPEEARLGGDVGANGPRTHFMRARLSYGAGGLQITPFGSQDSSLLSILSEANALLIRPVADGARKAGERVDFLRI